MQISQKSKEIIDSCRFCWMCRHICPIGNATGQERNNARARALSLSLVERGFTMTEDIIDNVYECALCGACTKECVTGWDPVKFTKEVRLDIASSGKLPDYIEKMIYNIEKTGNAYGETKINSKLLNEIESLPKTADTLLFLGKDAICKSPESAISAIKLLKKAKVSFTVLADEPDSGYAMDTLIGAAEETRQIMLDTAEKLVYNTIIVYDPADAKVFLREYKEWNIALKAKIKTFTTFVAELIKNGKLKPKKSKTVYTFQDPALLARDLEETAPARVIISACGELSEMLMNGKDTMWAGNLLMNEYMPKVMELVSSERWNNAINASADVLVTASPSEYEILLKAKPENMKLMRLEDVVLSALEEK